MLGESHLFFVKNPHAILASSKSGSSTIRKINWENSSYTLMWSGKFGRVPKTSYPVKHLTIVVREPKQRFYSSIKFCRQRKFTKSGTLSELVPKKNSEWKSLPWSVTSHTAPVSLAIENILKEVEELKSCETVTFIPLKDLTPTLKRLGVFKGIKNKTLPTAPPPTQHEWEASKHLFASDIELFEKAPFHSQIPLKEAISILENVNKILVDN